MKEQIPPDKPGHVPEQKVIDPLTGKDMTGKYVLDKREGFETCLREVFLEIARRAFNREENIARAMIEKALKCHREYFQAMKGATNLHPENIKDAVKDEEKRQKRFYDALDRLAEEFKNLGARFEVMPPDKVYKDSGWNTGLVHGCNIKTNGTYLCAFPLVPAVTFCYLAPVQEPVAAQVIFADNDCVILAPHSQDFGDAFTKAAERIFGIPEDKRDDFPKAQRAFIGNSFLSLVLEESLSSIELEELRKKYRVVAIEKGGTEFTGYIYTGKEDELPALLKKVFFQWHFNLKVFGR
jgi:hypothetical protein